MARVVCPKCGIEIPPDKINMQSGIIYCDACAEVFPVSQPISGASEPVKTEKPAETKVLFTRDANKSIAVMLPRGGHKTLGCFFVVFAVFWNIITWVSMVAAWAGDTEPDAWIGRLFLLPFIAVGAVLAIVALWLTVGSMSIAMDRENMLIRRECLGYKYDKRYPVSSIRDIKEAVAFTENDVPKFGIGIFIENKTLPVAFGSALSENERKWLIWELFDFWNQVRDQSKRWP